MSELLVTSIYNQEGEGAPSFPKGATVTGVITATSFSGSGANLTGIDATALKDSNGTVRVQANTTGAVITGNVSVGGTLTYEDVTNVDSVGLITARDGIHITSNIGLGGATYGTAGQVLTSGGSGANATWTTISAAPEYTGIASGSITAGRGVLVADDGKLMNITGFPGNQGNFTTAVSNAYSGHSIVYSTAADKFVMFYRDDGDNDAGKAVVGTQSGTTITWGTPVQFTGNAINSENVHGLYDSYNDKVAVLYRDNNNKGSVCVGTISGTSITFGTPVQDVTGGGGDTGSIEYSSFCYCEDTYNYAVVYNNSSGNKGWCRIGKYSGTNSSSWPNATVQFLNAQARETACWYDTTANKLIIITNNAGNSNYLFAYAGTVASDSVTFGSGQQVNSDNSDLTPSGCHNPDTGQNVICYQGTSNTGFALVATLSGTTFSFNTPVRFSEFSTTTPIVAYDSAGSKKFLISYSPYYSGVQHLETIVATVTGTTLSYATKHVVSGATDTVVFAEGSLAYSPDTKGFVTISRSGTNLKYYVESIRSSDVTSGNYIGIANASYTNGQTASIAIPGSVNTAVSGLTIGQKYYVIADGTLNTTADIENILAGNAVAANKLIVR